MENNENHENHENREDTEKMEKGISGLRMAESFRPIVETVMGEMSDENYQNQVIGRGLNAMLSDIILGHDVRPETEGEKKLLRTLWELFRKNPEEVSELVLEHLQDKPETGDAARSLGIDNYR